MIEGISGQFESTVIRTTRRAVTVADAGGRIMSAFNPPRTLDIVVGDRVLCTERGADTVIENVLERKNCLKRAVPEREKRLAANLDHLFIVAAVSPLFNTLLIDRISAAAESEDIACTLLVNKSDTGVNPDAEPFSEYRNTKLKTLFISAHTRSGFQELERVLAEPSLERAAFAGQSGVGKSSILNVLVPGADAQVSEVSGKSGQGRQTTSSGFAYHYRRNSCRDLFLIDLPGIQNFGISHLTPAQVKQAFSEFRDAALECQFDDCMHIAEPGCRVKQLLEEGFLSASRYESYLDMLRELDLLKKY